MSKLRALGFICLLFISKYYVSHDNNNYAHDMTMMMRGVARRCKSKSDCADCIAVEVALNCYVEEMAKTFG